jgi:hypothetical protein
MNHIDYESWIKFCIDYHVNKYNILYINDNKYIKDLTKNSKNYNIINYYGKYIGLTTNYSLSPLTAFQIQRTSLSLLSPTVTPFTIDNYGNVSSNDITAATINNSSIIVSPSYTINPSNCIVVKNTDLLGTQTQPFTVDNYGNINARNSTITNNATVNGNIFCNPVGIQGCVYCNRLSAANSIDTILMSANSIRTNLINSYGGDTIIIGNGSTKIIINGVLTINGTTNLNFPPINQL